MANDNKLIANRGKGNVLTNDGLALSGIAKKKKQEDNTVINATIGTLYDESLHFYKMETVDKIIKTLPDELYYTYATSDGGKEYQNAVLNWVFDEYKDSILSNMHCEVVATPGGTGAVSSGLFNSLDEFETLLLPDIYWSPYKNMASSDNLNVIEYQFIKNNQFNIEGFIEKAEEIICKQHKLVTILNDPCNNPTGYSLTNLEFEALLEYFNSKTGIPIYVIYDIAYFDYFDINKLLCRKKFLLMSKCQENIFFNIAFSCSKTFSMYGMRVGAQILLSKCQESVNEAFQSSCFLARTRWSNVSKAGINLLIEVCKNMNIKRQVQKEIADAVLLLKKRANIFTTEASNCDLRHYPYKGGFFITVNCKNGIRLAEELIKEKIYVLGFEKAVRIAICSLPSNEVIGLANKIKIVLDRLEK